MKLRLVSVYATVALFNILFSGAYFVSQWLPIVSLSLHPQVNACMGLETFADWEFLKLFVIQVALSIVLQVSSIWWLTNSVRHVMSLLTLPLLVLIPSLVALMMLIIEPLFVSCVN